MTLQWDEGGMLRHATLVSLHRVFPPHAAARRSRLHPRRMDPARNRAACCRSSAGRRPHSPVGVHYRESKIPSSGATGGRRDRPQRVLRPQVQAMNVKYFKDTDTALLEFSDAMVNETREITENIYVDLDKDGNLVSMTIEHAAALAQLPHVRVEEIDASAA